MKWFRHDTLLSIERSEFEFQVAPPFFVIYVSPMPLIFVNTAEPPYTAPSMTPPPSVISETTLTLEAIGISPLMAAKSLTLWKSSLLPAL